MKSSSREYLFDTAQESQKIRDQFLQECGETLLEVAKNLGECFKRGGKLLILGNGGSASDAQHMAAELVGRMLIDRRPLPAIALTTDTSILTAVGNDYGFDEVFLKQIQALAKKEDMVLAISTSGNSKNVVKAVEAAQKIGCTLVTLTGGSGGLLSKMGRYNLNASLGKNSSRIQETHIFAIHSIVDLLDRFYLG